MADAKKTTKKAIKPIKPVQFSELVKMDSKQLNTMISEIKVDIANLQYNTKLGDVQNVHACRNQRKQLARVCGALNQVSSSKEEK